MNLLICCSSRDEIPSDFLNIMDEIGRILQNKYRLIIGGCSSGMMARIIPYFKNYEIVTLPIYEEKIPNNSSNKIIYCSNTMERTNNLYQLADIILLMPGGIGTLAELFSTLEEARTIKNNKKIIIFNYKDYYKPVLDMIKKQEDLKFKDKDDNYYYIISNIDELEGVLS